MNAKQRRRERLRASAIEREADIRLMRKIAVIASGCSSLKVARAINGPSVRDVKEAEFVTRENPQYRKVNNPYGQHINARQKMRGCSIPLI
ncbi:hypothetical protein CI789_02580 [Erwinia persicina]|uniref:hypothetical protein n=1 Tax=Erwinia persicina TaxID=55211 RepID=UPI000E4BE224|nr:hypothetical protein [Erwinia persicina]AXU94210.1 hypothetical protein CI789_02580 [Erwinia persicina]